MILNRNKLTISRVIRRNTGLRGYHPKQAQRLTDQHKDDKTCSRIGDKVWATVVHLTRQEWKVSLWLKAEHSVRFSHSIDEHPAIVDTRYRFGDWELDTTVCKGYQQAIFSLTSLTERKSHYTLIHNIKRKTAADVSKAIIRLLLLLGDHVKTLTSSNGKEFAKHKTISQTRNADFYFSHPYASW